MRCSSLILSATTSVKIYLNNHLSLISSSFSVKFLNVWCLNDPFSLLLLSLKETICYQNVQKHVDTARDLGCNYYVKILIGRCDGINE